VRNVYRALQLAVPDALYASNISTAAPGGPLRPRAFMSPVIDGGVTGFAEWSAGVPAVLGAGGGTMHRVASELVQSLLLGVSRAEVFIRIDGASLVEGLAAGSLGLAILIGGAQPRRIELVPHANGGGVRVAVARVVEAALGFNALDAAPGDRLTLTVLVTDRAGHVVEQHPSAAAIEIEVPAADLEAVNWSV
jgi:hypothetical protein